MKDGNEIAVYIGTQPGHGDLPAIDLYNLTRPVGEYPEGATIGVSTLGRLGYSAPTKPEAYHAMKARAEAAESLVGELRHALKSAVEWNKTYVNSDNRVWYTAEAVLAKTPADMGAELFILRHKVSDHECALRAMDNVAAKLREQIAELERDKARLDWLVKEDARVAHGPSGFFIYWGDTDETNGEWQRDRFETPESAIDAAMNPIPTP